MKILLVDDEREEREGISWLIKKYKYPLEIVQAANGKEALQCIEKYKIDILFTDVKMPVMNGLELAKEVYKRPIAFAIVIQITPMVAAVPNAVPVRTETRAFKRNAIKIITDGFISPAQ